MTKKIHFRKSDRYETINHETFVNDHHVEVKIHDHGDDIYETDFMVNGATIKHDRSSVTGPEGAEIFNHIGRTLGHFVKKYKPKRIQFAAANPNFDHMYQRFGHSIARKTGGDYSAETHPFNDKKRMHVITYQDKINESIKFSEKDTGVDHEALIRGNHIKLHAAPIGDSQYNMNLKVSEIGNAGKTVGGGNEVMTHVRTAMHHFVKTYKPTKIQMTTADPATNEKYKQVALNVSKTTNGTYSTSVHPSDPKKIVHSVTFKKLHEMIMNFKQFISESFHDNTFGRISHSTQLKSGHHVDVNFHRDPGTHFYEVSFSVNGVISKKPWSRSMHASLPTHTQGAEVLKHVSSVIPQFVNKYKPHQIRFSAVSPEHESLYKPFAQKLAKQTGGKHSEAAGYHFISYPKSPEKA